MGVERGLDTGMNWVSSLFLSFLKNFFIVVQVQFLAFSLHPSPISQPSLSLFHIKTSSCDPASRLFLEKQLLEKAIKAVSLPPTHFQSLLSLG